MSRGLTARFSSGLSNTVRGLVITTLGIVTDDLDLTYTSSTLYSAGRGFGCVTAILRGSLLASGWSWR